MPVEGADNSGLHLAAASTLNTAHLILPPIHFGTVLTCRKRAQHGRVLRLLSFAMWRHVD
jgi:hypothetical protein